MNTHYRKAHKKAKGREAYHWHEFQKVLVLVGVVGDGRDVLLGVVIGVVVDFGPDELECPHEERAVGVVGGM